MAATTTARDAQIARNMRNIFNDPWYAIAQGWVYTLDQTNFKNPVKPFPTKPHLKHLTRVWEREPMLLIPKSRRMMLSWLGAWLHLWMAMFHPGRSVFIVSDKEQKSDELVRRCEFMYTNIPEGTILKPTIRSKYCALEFPGLDSYIMGLPSGAAQLRQYTASALLFDEFAFWGDAMETLGAARPTIEGGGRLTIISSAQDGPFRNLCFDETLA